MIEPRKPNENELNQLREYLAVEMGCWHNETDEETENINGLLENAAIAVFDDYITDCPGYVGKVIMVVWPGAPEMYEVFIVENEEFVHLDQDKGFVKEKERVCKGCGQPIMPGQATIEGEDRHSACC